MNDNWICCKTTDLKEQQICFIKNMVRKINRSAKSTFEQAYKEYFLKECFLYDDTNNVGVMTVIEGEDYISVQVSFEKDVNNYNIIRFIHDKINEIIGLKNNKDLYLNINAYNVTIINYFRNYNFVQDSHGFEFTIKRTDQKSYELYNFKIDDNLKFKKFEDDYSFDYLNLIKDSFKEQDLLCNEESNLGEDTILWLKKADENNEFGALWKDDCLIGLYVLDNEYIVDIAVLTKYKGLGYGTIILNHCLKDIFINKGLDECYLYTYAVNVKAQKMYLKNGFEVSAFYSENTLKN